MNLEVYISALAPELILAIGACAALLVGVSRSESSRSLIAPLSVVVVLLSLAAAAIAGVPAGA